MNWDAAGAIAEATAAIGEASSDTPTSFLLVPLLAECYLVHYTTKSLLSRLKLSILPQNS